MGQSRKFVAEGVRGFAILKQCGSRGLCRRVIPPQHYAFAPYTDFKTTRSTAPPSWLR
jgi:hypothetical protein